jgi:TolB-like protein
MPEVFISYARSTEPQARLVADRLKAAGYDVWRDDSLPTNQAYTDVIEEQLRSAKAVLALWSGDAVKSHWVRSEADFARRAGTLTQARLEPVLPPLPFDQIQCADLSRWKGDTAAPEWRKVLESVAELVAREPAPIADARPARWAWLTKGRAPWVGAVIVAAILCALPVAALMLHPNAPASGLRPVRLAVIPFDVTGSDPGLAAFATELDEKLADAFATNQMATVSRADALTLRGPDRDAAVARLGLDDTVEGAVRSDGKTLTVSLHLEDAKAHVILWTPQFTAPVGQAAQLRTDIVTRATRTINQLKDTDFAKAAPSTIAAFLAAGDQLDPAGGAGDEAGVAAIRQVVAEAPDFAPAHSTLAWALIWSLPGRPPDERAQTAAEAGKEAKRALELNPNDSEAYGVLAVLEPPTAYAARETLLLKGLAVGVNQPEVRYNYQVFLAQVGRMDDAVANARQTVAEDPGARYARIGLVATLLFSGRFDDADAALDEAVKVWPNESWFKQFRVAAAAQRPDVARTRQLLSQPDLQAAIGGPAAAAWVRTVTEAGASGDPAVKAAAARLTRAGADAGGIRGELAFPTLAVLGDVDGAFAVADAYFKAGGDPSLLFGPLTKSMRADERFMALAARIGLTAYWRATGHWPDFCAQPGLPYDCKTEAAKYPAS